MEMMLFFKILQMFLVPSVFIFILLTLGITLLSLKRRKRGKILLIIAIAIYYLFSITPVTDLILFPLENKYNPLEEINSIDTIVLLAGGAKTGDLTPDSNLSGSSLSRTAEAIRIYFKAAKKPKIIISGKEAYFIAKFIENFNIPQEDIILEEESKNTYESARAIKKIVDKEPFFLVTSAYHMPRSIYIFKNFEMNPIPVPCDYEARPLGKYNVLDFFPQIKNLKKVNLAFHEYFGILFLKFIKIYEYL